MTMMKSEVKAAWVDALRSGEYKQGPSLLTRIKDDVVTHCCLGVLCKIAVDEGLDITAETKEYGFSKAVYYNNEESVLPAAVQSWAGIDEENPVVHDEKHGRNSLAEFNDGGKSFNQIADIIERNL